MRTEIVEPVGGLNQQRPATNLRAGETPFSQNFVMGDRYIEPRSGISSWGSGGGASNGSTGATGTPLSFFAAPRSDRSEYGYVFSSNTARAYDLAAQPVPAWVPQATSVTLSGTTSDYYQGVAALNPNSSATTGAVALYVTNWRLPPKIVPVGQANLNPVSDLTGVFSLASYARYITAFDDRLILFHSGSTNTGTDYSAYAPTRVIFSARGNAFEFSAGGGFEDLADMQGVGTGAISETDRLVLLSSREVWVGRPRRDAYAFDFFNLKKSVGCPIDYDRTPRNTEAGTIWLSDGFQHYRVIGNEVRAVGDKIRDYLRDEMREWSQCWSLYHPEQHIYALFYSDTTGQYPSKAMFLRTDTVRPVDAGRDDGVWFMQDFGGYQFTTGGAYGGDMVLISSAGTAFRLLSSSTNDAGTAIDCRWRSHALRAERDLFPYEAMQEFWLEAEHNSTTTSTLSVFQSGDNGASFIAVGSASLTSGVNYKLVPVSAAAARNQMFELRLNDGTKPRLARMQLKLRGYTGRYTG